jgi:hypothetical protein
MGLTKKREKTVLSAEWVALALFILYAKSLLLQLKTSTSIPDLFSPKLVAGMMVVVVVVDDVVPFANVVIILAYANGRGHELWGTTYSIASYIFKHFHSISLESKAL